MRLDEMRDDSPCGRRAYGRARACRQGTTAAGHARQQAADDSDMSSCPVAQPARRQHDLADGYSVLPRAHALPFRQVKLDDAVVVSLQLRVYPGCRLPAVRTAGRPRHLGVEGQAAVERERQAFQGLRARMRYGE